MPLGIRNQSGFATHQSAASCFAAVAGLRVLGYRAGHRRSRSGVAGRRIGGPEPVGRIFQPSNGDGTQTIRSPAKSDELTQPCGSLLNRPENCGDADAGVTRGQASQPRVIVPAPNVAISGKEVMRALDVR